MGKCLSTDGDYDRSEAVFKYPAYDWFGEREHKVKDTKQISEKSTESTHEESTGIAVAIYAKHGDHNETVVLTSNSKDNKIAISLNMGQCTSAQTKDNSIEDEPYSVAPRTRRRTQEDPYVYRSRYEPYSWDIYVDTAYNKPVRNRDKERSFTSLKWDFYVEPEQGKETPEVEEEDDTAYINLHSGPDKIPNGEVTPSKTEERTRPDETHVKQPARRLANSVEEDTLKRVSPDMEEVPKKRTKEEPARKPFWVTERPTNKKPVEDREPPIKDIAKKEAESTGKLTQAQKEQPRRLFIDKKDLPHEPNEKGEEPLTKPTIGQEETSRKLLAENTEQDDAVSDDYDDDTEEDVTSDENNASDKEIEEKYAPPNYHDVVPNTISIVKYDDVPKQVSEKQRNAPEYKGKPNTDTKLEKSEKPTQVNGPVNNSPELRKKVETPKEKGEPASKPEKTSTVHQMTPKHINGLVKPAEKPVVLKDKKACEPVITKAVINPNPRPSKDDNLGTRPEKDEVKATVLIPNKFPQLFTGKRSAWRGLLLFGPAGSGKASLATAVAKEIGHSYCTLRTFMSLHSYKGNAISAMFKKARDNTPHVIIIDHLDGLSSVEIRELHKQMTSSSEEQFEGLLVVGISDSPWMLDKSIIELFEKRIYITLPSAASRAELFRANLEQSQHSLREEDFVELGAWSDGYSCADIITVVNETLMRSLRKIQEATYFKKMSSKDPVTNHYTDLYTPCSPGEDGAIEMDWTRVPEKKLQEPVIRLSDVLIALRTQKPSLHPDDIEKHKQFAKKFTQHCQ